MSRQQFAVESTIPTRLNATEQQAIAARLAAIVATQNSLPEADGKRRFYEELKNSLMLRQVLGSDFRIISVPRSAYLDSEAVDHLSNSLA